LTAKEIAATRCDLLVVDPSAADNNIHNTMALLRKISDFAPRMRVIVLGMNEDPGCFLEAVRAGVLGYILKGTSITGIISAVRSVMRGEAVCPPRLCGTLSRHLSQRHSKVSAISQLEAYSKRLSHPQRELLALVGRGLTNKEIAARLNLSEQAVRNHVHRVLRQVQADEQLPANLPPVWDNLLNKD
jgi:two-component system NarL family response regulator